MARNHPKVETGLYRYLYGMYEYYIDKGMNDVGAKVRMIQMVNETLLNTIQRFKDHQDHMLAKDAEGFYQHILLRGRQLSKQLENTDQDLADYQEIIDAVNRLEIIRKSLKEFIESYKGVN